MSNMSDGLGMQPRAKAPESNMLPGVAAPIPPPQDFLETSARIARALALPPGTPNIPDTGGPANKRMLQEPATWIYDFDPVTGTSRATFPGEVSFTTGGSDTAGVTSFNGRTGAVTLTSADLSAAGAAPLASPAFTGNPTVPTQVAGTSNTSIANTQFVQAAIAATPKVTSFNGRGGAVTLTTSDITSAGGAPTASPALTGTPTAPTAPVGNSSSQVASTAFVANAIASGTVVAFNGRTGAVTLSLTDVMSVGGAPSASPTLTGNPTAPTQAPGTSNTTLATTAFVTNAVTAATSGVASFNGRQGAVVLETSDIVGAGGAPLLSPNMTGTPTAPTAAAGTSSSQIATTAFVENAIVGLPGVSSFNGRQGAITLTTADVTSAGAAPIASPTLTGTPNSTTPTAGDNSTRIATTAFVENAVTAAAITVPLPINQGGTNRANWVTNGFVTYSSTPTPQMTPLGGNGVAVVNLNTPSIATTLPISMGGTGTGLVTQGLLTSDGTGNGSYTATPMKGGQMPLTDESGANWGTLGTTFWYRIGQLVWIAFSGAYPNTSGDTTSAILGPLPYKPVTPIPNLLRCNIANMGVLGVAVNTVVSLWNTGTSQAAMQNGGMANVSFQVFFVYQTNDAP